MMIVQGLARVLLHVQALDADPLGRAVGQVELDRAFADDRLQVLGDLIALGQIGIEVVLALEHRGQVDLGVQGQAGLDRLFDAVAVDHRQHAGHGGVDQRNLAVGRGAEGGGGAGEQLGLAGHLGMHLEPDDHLPITGLALYQGHIEIRAPSSLNSKETASAAGEQPLVATLTSPLKKASLTGFHATAKHIAAKAVSPSSETMRTI